MVSEPRAHRGRLTQHVCIVTRTVQSVTILIWAQYYHVPITLLITLFYRHSITETENVAIQNQKRVLLNAFQEEKSDYEMYSSAAHLDKVIVSNEIVKNTCWVDLIKCLCNNQHSITWKVYCLGNVVTKRFDFQFDFCF